MTRHAGSGSGWQMPGRVPGSVSKSEVPVDIGPRQIDQVRQLIREVREDTAERRDLSMILGIGPAYGRALREAGIDDYSELVAVDSQELSDTICDETDARISAPQIEKFQEHALALMTGSPRMFGEPFTLGGSFVALDLEYNLEPTRERIWLLGAAVVTDGDMVCCQFWADNDDDSERTAIAGLAALLAENEDRPLITWAGHWADLPAMRKAANRLKISNPFAGRDHRDVLLWARGNIRLPVPGLGLKGLADYFQIPRYSAVQTGLQAVSIYQTQQAAVRLSRARQLRQELLDYNRDDLESTVRIAQELAKLRAPARSWL